MAHKDKEKANAYQREWYARNRDKVKARRQKRKEKEKLYMKEYYAKNKDKIKEQCAKWRQNNKGLLNKISQEWKRNNPEKVKTGTLKETYGISLDIYQQMLIAQNNCCAICRSLVPGAKKTYFYVDHDHDTGKVRGLLCMKCNLGLSHFNDSPLLLDRAKEYLTAAPSNHHQTDSSS